MKNYRKDGYTWKKRRSGNTIREDHTRLKVDGIEVLLTSLDMSILNLKGERDGTRWYDEQGIYIFIVSFLDVVTFFLRCCYFSLAVS